LRWIGKDDREGVDVAWLVSHAETVSMHKVTPTMHGGTSYLH
jgi:hypothetical protein